jgi:hypothetical protein
MPAAVGDAVGQDDDATELGVEDVGGAAILVARLFGVGAGVDPACKPLVEPQDSMAKTTRAIANARPDFRSQFVPTIAWCFTKVTSPLPRTTILAPRSFDASRDCLKDQRNLGEGHDVWFGANCTSPCK